MEARRLLGSAHLGLGDTDAAEPLLRDVAERFAGTRTPDSWRRARALSAWGACLASQRRFEDAEPVLLQSHAVLVTEVGPASTATVDAVRRLVSLYQAWGKPDQAARWAGGAR